MPGAFDLAVIALLVTVGAVLSVGITWFVAARWKNRCGISYAIAAFVFYAVFFIAAFEYGILDAIRMGKTVPSDTVDTLLLGHGAITALGVTVLTLLVFGLEGWDLPTWLAVGLPIILVGSVRGTAVLLGWRALRWAWPRFRTRHRSD